MTSLQNKVIQGGGWVFLGRAVNAVYKLVRTIILARLLAPNDFGLFGAALLIVSLLETFSQSGLNEALIQQKKDIRVYLDTVWTFQLIRGGVLGVLLFVTAPAIEAFFNAENLTPIIRVLALLQGVKACKNVGLVYFQKDLRFHLNVRYQLINSTLGFVVGIVLAYVLRNVWALVYATLVIDVVSVILSYGVHPYRPRLVFDKYKFHELFYFGKYVYVQTVIVFFLIEGDDMLVGKVLGLTTLGLYKLAYRFSNLMATEVTHTISSVVYPAYAQIQDDATRLSGALLKVLQLTAVISFPLAVLIGGLAFELTVGLVGDKWLPMVPALRMMCVYGMLRSLAASFGPVYRALNRQKPLLMIDLTHLGILALIIYPLTRHYGIWGTAIAITIGMGVTFSLTLLTISKMMQIELRRFCEVLLPPLGFSSIMLAILIILRNNSVLHGYSWGWGVRGGLAAGFYGVSVLVYYRRCCVGFYEGLIFSLKSSLGPKKA